jgi:uncharacterized coiled-coil DUF342 family protein
MSEWSTRAAAEDAAEELAKLRDDLAALKGDLATLVRSLRSDADEMSEEAEELYARLASEGHRSARAAFHELEERPLTVLAIAFAAGLIGGRFLLR